MMGYSYNGSSFTADRRLQFDAEWSAGRHLDGRRRSRRGFEQQSLHSYGQWGSSTATSKSAPNNDYGDTLLKLSGGLTVMSYFTAERFSSRTTRMTKTSHPERGHPRRTCRRAIPSPTLLMAGGKDGSIYLLNRDALGGSGDAAAVQKTNLGTSIYATGAYWNAVLSGRSRGPADRLSAQRQRSAIQ